jgi:hypothetical protein
MPIRKITNATERKGVNFIRRLFEDANCVFKEVSKEHDYGHDAFVLIVDGESVTPIEIALQIKSGASYCKAESCQFSSTASQLDFWRQHPLPTLGIVFDPNENCAYWVDLKEKGTTFRFSKQNSQNIVVPKAEWNRINAQRFNDLFLPSLLRRPPKFSLETAIEWASSNNYEQHEIGLRTLVSKFLDQAEAWDAIFSIFLERDSESTSYLLIWALAHIPWHFDMFAASGSGQPSQALRSAGKLRFSRFGKPEVIKLLEHVDENGFERGSVGQSVAAILSIISNHRVVLREIAIDREIACSIRDWAIFLLNEGRMYLMRPR